MINRTTCARALAIVSTWALAGAAHAAAKADDAGAGDHGSDFNPMAVNWNMFFLFLGVFLVAFVILKKYAFGPILAGLDEREKQIRESVENAERIERELKEMEESRTKIIAEADAKAKEVIEEARKGAVETARHIEHQAKEEAKIMLENARREISSAEAQASAALREESARLAVDLAGKILGENLDDDKNRALADRLIAEM